MKEFFSKSTLIFVIAIILGSVLILYLSWISSPVIGSSILVPDFVSIWADTFRFQNKRTAVPLFGLSIVLGLFLVFKKANIIWWLVTWVFLFSLVILAELGQLFVPYRIFDIGDIKWGCLGATTGICTVFLPFLMFKLKKQKLL